MINNAIIFIYIYFLKYTVVHFYLPITEHIAATKSALFNGCSLLS
jgi:hypothetical protein